MGQSNMGARGYSMPNNNNQGQYIQNQGNWGVYPQMAMSPVNPTSLPSNMDPSLLASQLSQMHIGQSVSACFSCSYLKICDNKHTVCLWMQKILQNIAGHFDIHP